MDARTLPVAVAVLALASLCGAKAGAQSADRLGETWNGPAPSLMSRLLKGGGGSPNGAARPRPEVVRFNPAGDSGVARSLADAFGRTEEEKAAVAEAFRQILRGYEAEVAGEGRSHNLAAAMTFFISANVAAYHHTDLPADEVGERLFQSLEGAMAGDQAFARLSHAEKQRMHDWLVCMAGFVATGSAEARQNGDREALNNYGRLADYAMRLVLGVEVGSLSFTGGQLTVAGDGAAAPQTGGAATRGVAGVWSKSSSSSAGAGAATYVGYYKVQYHFKADGTYTFKAERRTGPTSQGFWTTEESGAYAVSGDSLTISPGVSKATLRSLEGAVRREQNNQLERVTYKWRLHHFEGLNETQLVLQTSQETARDGGFTTNSAFPNSYLYSPGSNLEWRF